MSRKLTSDEKKCAEGVLSFLLSSKAQDIMHIKSADMRVPVTEEALNEYRSVFLGLDKALVIDETDEFIFFEKPVAEPVEKTTSGTEVSMTEVANE